MRVTTSQYERSGKNNAHLLSHNLPAGKNNSLHWNKQHPDSGCFGISGVVISSALSKGWRSGVEAFCAGHFLRLTETGNRVLNKNSDFYVTI